MRTPYLCITQHCDPGACSIQAGLEGCLSGLRGMERPLDSSWELADSLMQTLSAPLPPGSPVAASYKDMMHQLKADVTSALLVCNHQDSVQQASQLQSPEQRICKSPSRTAGSLFLGILSGCILCSAELMMSEGLRACQFLQSRRNEGVL